ncbi:MAG: TolC family protein [Deltaproteobacteria bacterium]|nr:TolC family protein [Deltaproteobacteria bacterium]
MLIHSAQAGARPESPTPQDNANEKPLTLHDCFESALTHNQNFQIQEEELRAAEGRYFRALSTVLPHLSVKGSEFVQDTSGTGAADGTLGSTFLRKSRPEVAVNLSQPLFQGLREYSGLAASSSDKERSRLKIERGRDLLFLEVAQLFLITKELEIDFEILNPDNRVAKVAPRCGDRQGSRAAHDRARDTRLRDRSPSGSKIGLAGRAGRGTVTAL